MGEGQSDEVEVELKFAQVGSLVLLRAELAIFFYNPMHFLREEGLLVERGLGNGLVEQGLDLLDVSGEAHGCGGDSKMTLYIGADQCSLQADVDVVPHGVLGLQGRQLQPQHRLNLLVVERPSALVLHISVSHAIHILLSFGDWSSRTQLLDCRQQKVSLDKSRQTFGGSSRL